MVRTLLTLTTALALGGCKDKPGTEAASLAGSGSSGSGSAAPSRTRVDGRATAPSKPIQLPSLSGKPPAKTTKMLAKPQFEALATLEFPGFKKDVRTNNGVLLLVRHELVDRPKIAVKVVVRPCSKEAVCNALEVANWSKDKLKQFIVQPLRDAPDLTLDVGETDLAGAKLIWTYELGQVSAVDATGPSGQYMDTYTLHFNDGTNQVRVEAFYADDQLASKEALATTVPKEHLERIAKAFLDTYVQAWAK